MPIPSSCGTYCLPEQLVQEVVHPSKVAHRSRGQRSPTFKIDISPFGIVGNRVRAFWEEKTLIGDSRLVFLQRPSERMKAEDLARENTGTTIPTTATQRMSKSGRLMGKKENNFSVPTFLNPETD